jgi:hypothetical protein
MTAQGFKQALMIQLGLASNQLEVAVENGKLIVTFLGANATASFAKATNMTSTQLGSLGAASVSSIAPGPAPAADDDEFPLPAAIGGGVGGLVFIIIIILVAKNAGKGKDGDAYLQDDRPGDQPMLMLPQNNGYPQGQQNIVL